MTKKPRTNLGYVMLGVFGPFAAIVIAVVFPLLFVFYWMGRLWAKVPIINDMFTEEHSANGN